MNVQRLLLADDNIDQLVDGVSLLLYMGWGTFASESSRRRRYERAHIYRE